MSKRFLITKIPLANVEEDDKLEEILGKRPDPEISYGETVIDLLEVSAIREAYKDNDPLPDEAVVYMYGDPYYVQTPYEQVKKQWLELFGEIDIPAPQDVGQAVATLARALDEDKSKGSLYYGYQSNIAMAFTSAYMSRVTSETQAGNIELPQKVVDIANKAAKNFLDQLIQSVK